MQFVSDLHLHSKYSRAVSQQMVLPEMAKWGIWEGEDLAGRTCKQCSEYKSGSSIGIEVLEFLISNS